ncbi:MAG: guanylate kinase [Magnetococcales bacterium]|nr:guanylate kinase [Magnetococcales bacterium]
MSIERGFLLILSGPSGVGKSTLSRDLRSRFPRAQLSISVTTRAPRSGEQEGVHYYFVDLEEFNRRLAEHEFLEWAEVFGNRYGTSRLVVEKMLTEGAVVLLDIDWQGARQVRQLFAKLDVVSVFIAPPSLSSLQQRLMERGDDPQVYQSRMTKAKDEISHWQEYDYFILNDDLEKAKEDLAAILRTEELRRERVVVSKQQVLVDMGS